MGIDCKGCVVVEEKNAFKIGKAVHDAIADLIKKDSGMNAFELRKSEDYTMPRIEMWTWADCLTVHFKYKGEDRSVNISFDCDCDLSIYPEIKGTKCIWFSLGHWGSSEKLMHSVLKGVKQYGKVYIDVNDSDAEGFKEI